MTPEDLPVIGTVFRTGPTDGAFDLLVLTGPPVVATVAVVGRTAGTVALASAYLLGFVLAVAYKGVVG